MTRKKVLVTGALGQLGRSVVDALSGSFRLIPADLVSPEEVSYLKDYIKMDISDPFEVERAIKRTNPDVVLNLAAMTDVDGCESDPDRARLINEDGVRNILRCFWGKIIQISTDYVFNGNNGPYSEDDPVSPTNVYGLTKLNAEKIIQKSSNPWLIVRTNVLFDYTDATGASFVKWVIDSLASGKPIKVVNDQWGNPTWTRGLADCVRILLENDLRGLYNYAGKDFVNRLDFAMLISEIFDLDSSLIKPVSTGELNQLAERPLKGGLKTQKIENALNLDMIPLKESLRQIRERMNS